jgi:hypothetical protein
MTRKADGRRFLACRSFYDERVRCDYTDNAIPQHILMQEAGAQPLPGLGI